MKKIFKSTLFFAALLAVSAAFTSCNEDNNDNNSAKAALEAKFQTVNEDFVNKSVLVTYRALADGNKKLVDAVEAMKDDAGVEAACEAWKESRRQWEYSEAFLFGPATVYSIDPHTDTWPFDATKFDNLMKNFNPSDDISLDNMSEIIRTTENLTGFHAVEYILFRDGEARPYDDLSDKDLAFCKLASQDLYLASLKLVSAWGGELSEDEQAILDDAEFESAINYGDNFVKAGKAGSTYSDITTATLDIISGAREILGEVADSKIGAPYTGANTDYIESPYSHNSITDFYDNIMSCKHTLYGGADVNETTPNENSLIGVCLKVTQFKSLAEDVEAKLEIALEKTNSMKRPFVTYYKDASAGEAKNAISNLDAALQKLEDAIRSYN